MLEFTISGLWASDGLWFEDFVVILRLSSWSLAFAPLCMAPGCASVINDLNKGQAAALQQLGESAGAPAESQRWPLAFIRCHK